MLWFIILGSINVFTALKSPTTIALSGEYAAIEMVSLSILIKAKYSEEDNTGGHTLNRF